jgi:hypothetical protein
MTRPGARRDVSLLLAMVDDARHECERIRTQAGGRTDLARAQAHLRSALETYATALRLDGAPLPHRLQIELATYRSLAASEGAR